jgi:uncharacterized protein
MINIVIAGLVLGLISSFHCVGMCGTLALALPVKHLGRTQQFLSIFLYNIGRVITYSILGAIFGLAGRGLYLAGFQQWFSIIAGSLILVFALQYFTKRSTLQPAFLNDFYIKIQSWMHRFLQSRKPVDFILLGIANGLLPCGMVYLAIAGALNTSAVTDSVAFMFSFGMGTLPAMFALTAFSLRIDLQFRNRIKKAMPYFIACVAVLLILRGFNLGIPFVSPVLANTAVEATSCH